jgi:hypothetical protein
MSPFQFSKPTHPHAPLLWLFMFADAAGHHRSEDVSLLHCQGTHSRSQEDSQRASRRHYFKVRLTSDHASAAAATVTAA